MRISAYEDDPFVRESIVRLMDPSRFSLGDDGRLILSSSLVTLTEASKIYRRNSQTNQFNPFAWNPWPAYATPNLSLDFRFPDETRFPLHKAERDAEGKVILRDGLQVWTPRDLRLGSTTAFEAAHAVKEAAESWAGRDIAWGVNGVLDIEPHAFVDFNAFYSGNTRSLFFAVVPYRLPGETDVKIFETVTSWEMVAHECGHALHHPLKPNRVPGDQGYDTWSESFGDQMVMWVSLQYRDRALKLLAETGGDLNRSSFLTRLVEAFSALTGSGTGIRDAFNDLKVSDTTDEVHDRSEVFTGAAYKIFLKIYDGLKNEFGPEEGLLEAGRIMGFFLTHATDYTPENLMTLEDVAKAYLKVDKEFFGSRYHDVIVDEFIRREIFDAESVSEWMAHEAATPKLWLNLRWPDHMIEQMLRANLDKLGIGPDFDLKLQSVTRINHFNRQSRPSREPAQTVVRAQLTRGRGEGLTPLDNHGILVFGASGRLTDYHSPLPQGDTSSLLPDVFAQTQAVMTLSRASQLRLDERGAPLSLVRKPDGQWTVEARVLRGEGLNAHLEVFTPENPRGERREVIVPPVPPHKRIPIPEDILK
jgi:hypothetical protein